MSDDLKMRLRNQIAYDRWNMGEGEVSDAADALARINQLEAALQRSALEFNDFDDGTGGYWRCGVCRATARIGQPKRLLVHKDDCLMIALGANDE